MPSATSVLAPYLPRLVRLWSVERDAPRAREIEATLVSIDISGFTALAERLAVNGKAGAEELVQRISSVFDDLIAVAERHGGDVLKFRGDALLLLFLGDRHAERAAGAASDMQWTIEEIGGQESSVGPVELRMSVGVHSGLCHFFLTDEPHRELLVAGPAATRVFELEDLATAGEIMVSAETAAHLDPAWIEDERDGAILMRRLAPGASTIPPPPEVPGTNLEEYVPRPLRDHLSVASGEAEHRQVTLSFLKLSGTDAAIENGTLLGMLDELAVAVGRACETYGLTWLESDIDVDAVKLYLTAGAPSSSGDDEEGMVRGLRDVIAACPDLPLRAGVNRGHVFTGDIGNPHRRTYAVMGDAVNLAARLSGKAGPEEVVTVAPVLDRARTLYDTEVRTFKVKGKALEIEAYVVGDALGQRDPDDHLAGALIGRDEELAQLLAALDEARAGRQQVVELVGPPGIGKSHLLATLVGHASDAGFERLQAATDPYSSAEPYSAFRTLLRRVAGIADSASREVAGAELAELVGSAFPDLVPWLPLLAIPIDADATPTPEASGLDPERSRTRIHQLVESFLDRSLANRTLIVLEDAHWLDDASEFLLRHLVDRPGVRPWLVCVTTRSGRDPFAKDHFVHATKIELAPLSDEFSESLTLEIAAEFALSQDDVRRLVLRAGGNPLFVRELVTAARSGQPLDTLPDSVESLLTARIDTLAPSDRLLLRYAAVVGPSFELSLLSDVLQDEAPDAGLATRWAHLSEFVTERERGTLAFQHDLVRATAYEGLSFQRRREIHGRVGLALEHRAGSRADEEAALLSLHFAEAGDDARTWKYAVMAGRRAQQGFANIVAAELYERALVASGRQVVADAAEVADVAEALGDVSEHFGAYDRAAAAYDRVQELLPDDVTVETRLYGKRGALRERVGEYDEALALYEVGLARLDDLPADEVLARNRAEIEIGAAGVWYRKGQFGETVRLAEQAAVHADGIGDRGLLAHAYYLRAAGHNELGQPDGIAFCEKALVIYEELRDFVGMGRTLNNLGIRHYYAGQWDDAVDAYERGRAALERAGDVVGEAMLANNAGEVLSDQGHLEPAEKAFRHFARAGRAAGYPLGEGAALSNLARLEARAARYALAHELFDDALDVFARIGSAHFEFETTVRRGECLVFEARHGEALALLLPRLDGEQAVGPVRIILERTIGYALHQAGRPDEAHPHLEASLALAREVESEYEESLCLRAMAETHNAGPAERHRADAILERLGVVSVPAVPLP